MAHATVRHEQSHSIFASILGTLASWRDDFLRYREFERTYNELSALSDRELSDIGLSRSDLTRASWDAVHKD